MRAVKAINIQQGADILEISIRTLYQRIRAGYYDVEKVGAVLVDPETGKPLTMKKLKSIPIRPKGRQAGRYGHYQKSDI